MLTLDPLLHSETITVVRRVEGDLDDYNNPIVTEETHDVAGVNVQPVSRATSEATSVGGSADLVTGRWLCSGPISMNIRADDAVLWRGDRYTVEGYPQQFRTLIGICDHTEVWLKRTEG
jgi:hypothetical protein